MPRTTPLKLALEQSGRDRYEVASETTIDYHRLSRLANGRIPARPDEQKALAKALRRKIADLFPMEAPQ